jgi:hypothetical protein
MDTEDTGAGVAAAAAGSWTAGSGSPCAAGVASFPPVGLLSSGKAQKSDMVFRSLVVRASRWIERRRSLPSTKTATCLGAPRNARAFLNSRIPGRGPVLPWSE